jgi:hypothetical protein
MREVQHGCIWLLLGPTSCRLLQCLQDLNLLLMLCLLLVGAACDWQCWCWNLLDDSWTMCWCILVSRRCRIYGCTLCWTLLLFCHFSCS